MEEGNTIEPSLFTFGTTGPYTFKASRTENPSKNKAKKKNVGVMRSSVGVKSSCSQSSVSGASGVPLVNVKAEEKEKEKALPKNYDCKLCGHTTTDPEKLEKHMNSTCKVMTKAREILNTNKEARGLESYDCNLCGYHVSTKKELEKHLRNTCKVIKARESEQVQEKVSLGRLDNSGAASSSSSSGQSIKMKYMKALQ